MIITKVQFLDRFTVEETAAILLASDTVPAIRVYLFKLQVANDVDLCNADTIAGVQALEAAGLIGAGRSAEILASQKARLLHPWNDIWPGEYSVVSFDGETYRLEEAGDFASGYVEIV